MSEQNRQINLAARPVGFPKESDFALAESPKPTPGDGEFLVHTKYVTVDPYMRGRMNEVRAYADPFQIGKVIEGGAVGEIEASSHSDFKVGDIVQGMWGWKDYHVSGGGDVQPFDTGIAPITTSLGVLGMPGMTAYFGLLEITDPKEGETVFVSGAAGAVGELVGQIAKIKGCTVAGSAGTDEKVEHILANCGYDAAFNYKTTDNYVAKLQEICPKGIDVYFDNVGGATTDAVMQCINSGTRISICGAISQYNLLKPEPALPLFSMLLVKQARAEGFLVPQFAAKWPDGLRQMAQWIGEGKIAYREDILDGLENTPKAFIRMLNGENKGKQLVKVS
ncbi:MAG: NADP-dependent oxidoreductase [Candidatus Hydrogenedentes bacterium]|nr:NADP-dependent oxidoreductase [Candidatus Hydrogenedentota bacterium]